MKCKGVLLTLLITVSFLVVYYSHQLRNANNLSFASWGDGYKNYYTIAYYLKHDSGTHFTGMNYPYGENVVFTDNQPAFAWMLKLLSKPFPAIPSHIHAFIVYGILISVLIAAAFLFLILYEFEVPWLPGAIFASFIALLSPQLCRLLGHFALGYSLYLPILIYLLIRFLKTSGSLRIFMMLTLTLLFFSFVHVYYLAMGGFFIVATAFFYMLANIRKLRSHLRFIALLVSSAIIPFIVFKAYLFITDLVGDRPHSPWGYLSSNSTIADIFLHPHSFTGEVAQKAFPHADIVYHFEGMGYIGLIPDIALLCALIFGIITLIKKTKQGTAFTPSPWGIFLAAGFVVLLFAMTFPFNLSGMEVYYQKLPSSIRQFRAAGRFSWVFYYVATIYSSIVIYRFFKYLGSKYRKIVSYIFIVLVIALWFCDMNMVSVRGERDFESQSLNIDEPKESAKLLEQFASRGIKIESFQAILSLPFFLNGSEKIYIDNGGLFDAMKTSLFTGLPLVDCAMSRTSEKQAFASADLLGDDYIAKSVIKEYPNSKPLLLQAIENNFEPNEHKLIQRAHFLFSMGNASYYELPLSAFSDSINAAKDYFAANRSQLFNHTAYLSNSPINNVVVEQFEDKPASITFSGKGALFVEHGQTIFYNATLPNATTSDQYLLSLWSYADDRRAAFPAIYLEQLDATGNVLEKLEAHPKFSTNTYGKWILSKINFTLHDKTNKIHVFTDPEQFGGYDELMIRPTDIRVITGVENNGNFLFNNYPIR